MVEEERGLDLPVSSDRRAVGQFARYFLVSLVGFAADIGLFWLLNDVFAVHHLRKIIGPGSFRPDWAKPVLIYSAQKT